MKKILNNKFVKVITTIFKVIVWVIAILIVAVIVMQRVFNNKVSISNFRIFTIATGSMLPEYEIGDVIIVGNKDYDKIKIGDDLVYMGEEKDYKGKIITHRVINTNYNGKEYSYTTQGISNPEPDPLVNQKQVYGVVKYKPVVLSLLSHILNNSYGFYFLVFVPIALLIFLEILDFIKEREEKIQDEQGQS